MNGDEIEAVLLDVGGVFVVPHPDPVGAALVGLCEIDQESAQRAHYAGVAAVDVSSADDPLPDYLRSYASTLGLADDALDVAVERLTPVWAQPSIDLWRLVVEGSVRGLGALSELGVKLGIVSNSDGTVEEQLTRHRICQIGDGVGVPVLAILDSAVVGVAKPDPRIFEQALEALDVKAANTWFVGDSVRFDVDGATGAGLSGVHLDPYGLCADPRAHLHVQTLADLTHLLGEPPEIS